MSSSAINTQVAQLKIGNVQNQADNSAVYSGGVWSLKNSTALTSVTIDNSGNVGIGTTSPSANLDVPTEIRLRQSSQAQYRVRVTNTDGNGRILVDGDSSSLIFGTSPAGTNATAVERMRIDASGNLLVGKTTNSATSGPGVIAGPDGGLFSIQAGAINFLTCYNTGAGAYRFYVTAAGQINATSTSIAGISDVSLKENIRDLETGLSEVLALKPRRFDWKKETKIEQKNVAGFIAQEVEQVLPELIYEYNYSETEIKKSLKMGDMLPTLVKAIQELSAKVDAQAAEIEALKAKP